MNTITRHPNIHAGIRNPSKGPIHIPLIADSQCWAIKLSGRISIVVLRIVVSCAVELFGRKTIVVLCIVISWTVVFDELCKKIIKHHKIAALHHVNKAKKNNV